MRVASISVPWVATMVVITAPSLILAACGDQERPASAGFVSSPPDAQAIDGGSVFGTNDSLGGEICAEETKFVYIIDAAGNLQRFDPPSLSFAQVGRVDCPGRPYSMAVDRTGVAWVLFDDGVLARVSTRTAMCRRTPFNVMKSGFPTQFGMGFSTNGDSGANGETLFISKTALGTLDTGSFLVTQLGTYTLNGDTELTGTGDGRLFAVFEGDANRPFVIVELDKTTAAPLTIVPQPAIKPSTTGAFSLAFAFWGGDFYAFSGPATYTDVYRYRPEDGTTTKVATVDFPIVGAGVSTCAPITPPR